jgi:hypothetical protein
VVQLQSLSFEGRHVRVPPLGAFPYLLAMAERPIRFEHARWLGDKRSQVVYDVDSAPQDLIDELVAAEMGQSFGPDTLVEARNRGYRPHGSVDPDAEG